MIGVVAEELELAAVREFFELFKSPWELYRSGRHYDVVLSSSNRVPENDAALVVIYGSQQDYGENLKGKTEQGPKLVRLYGKRIPIYGSCFVLDTGTDELLFRQTEQSFAPAVQAGNRQTVV